MKTDSVSAYRKSGKRPPLWVCALLNQLAFPGLGTILAGRRFGYPQAAIMVLGFVLVVGYLLWYLVCAARYVKNPSWTEAQFESTYRPYLWALYDGVGMFLVAWIWALFSSLSMWRQRKAGSSPPDSSGAGHASR